MARIYDSILDTVGRTPLVRAPRFTAGLKGDLIFKLESFNPMSSVKDRPALAMVNAAQERGEIHEGTTLIEPTSGNTGIALAQVCAARGIRLVITMPESMSLERRKIMQAFGAEIVLTEAGQGMKGAIAKAKALCDETPGAIILGQFSNAANPEAHRRTTGPEIWQDTDGAIDIFVAGVGTGGTITGTGHYLKDKKPGVRIVAVEPRSSPVLSGGSAGPHGIQGIGAGFIPEIMDIYINDEIIQVADEEAIGAARELCREDGIMVGLSSGAVAWAGRQLAAREDLTGQMVVALLASHGERYLSTGLF